ncbi:MAG: hypothetical protein JNL58_31040 [Planctomyces sp.]|nr:hypothetical protein [Planctomyces sp.]
MNSNPQQFSPEELHQINAAVLTAESTTSAEIVPVIASRSGNYDRVEDLFGVFTGSVSACIAAYLWPVMNISENSGYWGYSPSLLFTIRLLLAFYGGFIFGAVVCSRFNSLLRLLAPDALMRAEVHQRAQSVFMDQRIHHTSRRSGILIYLSLAEHIAVVLPDQNMETVMARETAEDICRQLTREIRTHGVIPALDRTIRLTGEKLAAAFPAIETSENELPNALVVLDS